MPSIVNGLFAGRSGISSQGAAIAVVGDNISNANTVGYKATRAEFDDLVAGGQGSGRTIGSGSQLAAVTNIFQQGTLEFSGRNLDLAIDGNGFFVVDKGGQRYYTRAGNFNTDSSGFIVDQAGNKVLGFPSDGTGALEPLNVNTVSQNSVGTTTVTINGNLDASAKLVNDGTANQGNITAVAPLGDGADHANTTTYSAINSEANYSTVVDVFDSLGAKHTVNMFFYKVAANEYKGRAYVDSDQIDPNPPATTGPRQLTTNGGSVASGTFDLKFKSDGTLDTNTSVSTLTFKPQWNNKSTQADIKIDLSSFTQYSTAANINSIAQDGKGIGTVGNISIEKNGQIFALLSNGQAATIGTMGLAYFSNQEGLTRAGNTLLAQSPSSGEPVIGKPQSGTFGAVQSGSLELSTVDIASEFVKLITLQRGFQANSRIISTINQLLNDIVQLV